MEWKAFEPRYASGGGGWYGYVGKRKPTRNCCYAVRTKRPLTHTTKELAVKCAEMTAQLLNDVEARGTKIS